MTSYASTSQFNQVTNCLPLQSPSNYGLFSGRYVCVGGGTDLFGPDGCSAAFPCKTYQKAKYLVG